MDGLRIVATTPAGYASADPWSPSLDGILAYWALREQLGDEAFALGCSGHTPLVEAALPLARCGDADTWWWACSSPIGEPDAGQARRYMHRRFDAEPAQRYTAARKVLVAAGPYKQYRMPVTIRLTPTVTWHAIGDLAEVRRLLRRCTFVGAKGGSGCGVVQAWSVTPDGDEALARWHRPLPVAVAAAAGRTGLVLDWGLVPPGRRPEHRRQCVMPLP